MCGQWAIIIIVSILNFPLKQCDGLQNARVKTKFGRPGVHKIIIIIVHGAASTWEPNRLNVLMDFLTARNETILLCRSKRCLFYSIDFSCVMVEMENNKCGKLNFNSSTMNNE